jgi:hypothetical protein
MLSPLLDWLRGKAVTIPPMDGPLRPNNALDLAREVLAVAAPDNLVAAGGRLLFSSGARLLELDLSDRAAPVLRAEFGAAVTALAADAAGRLAVGLDDGTVALLDRDGAATVARGICPTALAFAGPDDLIVCQGAAQLHPSEWARDLMQKGASGSVWRLDLRSGERRLLAGGLAFPFGALVVPDGIVIAEAWQHRLVRLPLGGGAPAPILSDLPGYPSRLAHASAGGAWLSIFAPRNRLIEFVLEEDDYRDEMLRDVAPEFWIAPTLQSRRSFLEPLQCGAVRTMGIHKPWAPSRSHGLVVKLDGDFRPVASCHSRSDGTRHGVTSAVEHAGRVYVAAKGGNTLLELPSKVGAAR